MPTPKTRRNTRCGEPAAHFAATAASHRTGPLDGRFRRAASCGGEKLDVLSFHDARRSRIERGGDGQGQIAGRLGDSLAGAWELTYVGADDVKFGLR